MFGTLGTPEIIIIGIVIILIFGVGKISGIGRDLGSSIKEFRKAVKDEDGEAAKNVQQTQAAPPPQQQYQQPQAQYTPPPPPPPQPPAAPNDQKTPNIF